MKIEVKGPIISDGDQIFYDWFGIPATSANKVNREINKAKDGEELEVIVNSGGGSVFAGSEIYTSLKEYKGKVIIKVVGLAASAASVVIMGGDVVWMTPTGHIMMHNASCGNAGDHRTMTHTAEVLKSIDESISNAYVMKTGKTKEELLELMGHETWMSAKKAKELGFIDKVMFEEDPLFTNTSTMADGTLPPEVIEKLRNEMMVDGKIVASTEKPVDEVKPVIPQEIKPDNKLAVAKARLRLSII